MTAHSPINIYPLPHLSLLYVTSSLHCDCFDGFGLLLLTTPTRRLIQRWWVSCKIGGRNILLLSNGLLDP